MQIYIYYIQKHKSNIFVLMLFQLKRRSLSSVLYSKLKIYYI